MEVAMKSLKRLSLVSLVLLLGVVVAGCGEDFLTVENQNAPDTERALSSPDDVEALIAGSALSWWSATNKSAPSMALSTIADELTSSWGNWHMRAGSSEPRQPYDNSPSYRYRGFVEVPWYTLYEAISSANTGLRRIAEGMVIGDENRTQRAKGFAKFVQGLSHGFLALFFDKAFIFDETVNIETDQLDFSPYNEVMDAAIAQLQEAIAIFNANSFTIPNTWINGLELSNEDLAKLAHSYIARYMAGVARSPDERAAVNWSQVLQHAEQGITEDFAPIGDGDLWWTRLHGQGQHPIWVRADYMNMVGLADTSGNYQAWLDTPLNDRMPFRIHTADQRFPVGDPEGVGTDFRWEGTPRHRPDRGTYHFSFYFHYRYKDFFDNGFTGPMTAFKVAELDLLKAEALFRLGQSGAAELINKTRVARGGLPPVSDSDPDLWDKLWYEKRVETYLGGSAGLAYFDARGWGILISGTPIHWPVPGKELEILQQEIYTFGGVGGPGSVPKVPRPKTSTYERPGGYLVRE
jgi:hypothetical protein